MERLNLKWRAKVKCLLPNGSCETPMPTFRQKSCNIIQGQGSRKDAPDFAFNSLPFSDFYGRGEGRKEGRPMTIKGERPDSVSPATTGNTFCTLAHRPGFLEFVCTPKPTSQVSSSYSASSSSSSSAAAAAAAEDVSCLAQKRKIYRGSAAEMHTALYSK